ncbi:DnaD domain protein [Staphylococcus xylosus]|uniref:DnaD domain protein n=1 Tax=Staphylococcus xylosus TaxID=1288 RepID=UPI001CDC45C5|nr:DnaD domain protein [Staphylococcus xylosus]MCQ3816682.1 DnaD domain protein [Staphylococcus xylosus]MCQ3819265.1 DnaD domain protein [Staphylococcus xylosus]UBV36693.1 DnaD domain protein [Staphylococcus xylosus]
MATFRTIKESGEFVTVHKTFVFDERLSAKAKGILLYFLSRPDDWQIYSSEVVKHMSDGQKSVNSGINELINYGYVERSRKRKENGDFAGYEYLVYEKPKEKREMPFGENAKREYADGENVKREYAKGRTTNNNRTNNELTNNKNTKNDSSSTQLSPFDFYQENGFGMLKPYVAEQISYWIDDFKDNGNEIVIEAMKEAVNNNVTNWRYVNSILKAWYNDGVKTTEDIQARNNKRTNKQDSDYDNSQYNDIF